MSFKFCCRAVALGVACVLSACGGGSGGSGSSSASPAGIALTAFVPASTMNWGTQMNLTGTVTVTNTQQQGFTVAVYLPLATDPTQPGDEVFYQYAPANTTTIATGTMLVPATTTQVYVKAARGSSVAGTLVTVDPNAPTFTLTLNLP